MPTEADEWQELMGTDLCMKVLRHQDGDDGDGDEDEEEEEQSVQLHDIVEIDWIGYYCDDATKRQLGIPSSSLVKESQPLLPVESPPVAATTSPTTPPHAKHNHVETDTTTTSSSVLSILNECPIFHSVQNLYCDVGDQDVIPAVEMGLRFLHLKRRRRRRLPVGDEDPRILLPTVALIYSHSKYAYGISSRTYSTIIASDDAATTTTGTDTHRNRNGDTLPSLSNVIYKVTLKRIVSSSSSTTTTTLSRSPKVLLQLFKCKKHLANDIYQNDILVETKNTRDGPTTHNPNHNSYHCQRAVRIYQRTVEKLENFIMELQNDMDDNGHDLTTSYIKEAQQLQIDCLNNISAVYLKCRWYRKAKEACIETLLKDPNNTKALVRAAKAALYDPASSYEEVQTAVQAVQDIMADATLQDATTLQKDVTVLKKEYVQHQAKYKREQKQMAVRIQEKFRNRPPECPTDVTTIPASSRPRSTTTDDARAKPAGSTGQQVTPHDAKPAASWCGMIPTSFHVPTTKLAYTLLRILLLWILCLYGFMGYLLYAPQRKWSESMRDNGNVALMEQGTDEWYRKSLVVVVDANVDMIQSL